MCVQDSAFSSNANLQNLLIITALKSAPDRVPDYIHRLEGFEPKAVAQVRAPARCLRSNLACRQFSFLPLPQLRVLLLQCVASASARQNCTTACVSSP